MELGTWGEWAGAIGTTAAAGVALYLGGRDDQRRTQRLKARHQLRSLASLRLRAFQRWALGVEDPDGPNVTHVANLDRECAGFYAHAVLLGRWRRRRALRILRVIYGDRAVEHVAVIDDPVYVGTDWDPVTMNAPNPSLVVDGEPGPLRRRGALDVKSEDYRRLVTEFRTLSRI